MLRQESRFIFRMRHQSVEKLPLERREGLDGKNDHVRTASGDGVQQQRRVDDVAENVAVGDQAFVAQQLLEEGEDGAEGAVFRVIEVFGTGGVEEGELGGVGGGSDTARLEKVDVVDEGTNRLGSRGELRAVREKKMAVGFKESDGFATIQEMHLLPVKEVGILRADCSHEGIHPANGRFDRRQGS